MDQVKRFGIIGSGIIGAGWAGRALSVGMDVYAFDPEQGAESRLRKKIDQIWPVLERTGLFPDASKDRLVFCESVESVAAQSDFIQ